MALYPKSVFLSTRVTKPVRAKFMAKCSKFGSPSDMLRELIEAFNDDRLIIHPPVNKKDSLYVTRK